MVDPHPGSIYTIRSAAWLPGYTPASALPRYRFSPTEPTELPMKARLRGKSSLPVKHSIHPSPHRARTPVPTQFPAGTSVLTSDDGEFDEVTIGPSADDSGVL